MEIIHERPSQRLHYRVTAPMRVGFDGAGYDAVDWGLGGCRVSGFSDDFPEIGTQHTLFCTLPFQGFNITLQTDATVVRVSEEDGHVAFRFTGLGERETALMQHFVEDLVRGKMTDVEDTIVRIDTPVTPVPTKPDPNPAQSMPVRRWPLKQIFMTLFYFSLGAAVFGYVGVYIFATLFRLEVQSAVVTADRTSVTAPVTGRIVTAAPRPGATLTAGSLLLTMEDTSHEKTVRQAKTVLAATRAELAEKEALLALEKQRAEGYALVARNNVRQAESQLEGLELAKANAVLKLERLQKLAEKGLTRADDVEAAELSLRSVTSELKRKEIHIQELNELIEGGESVRLFTGTGFAGRMSEMEAGVARLKAELAYQEDLVIELSAKDTRQTVLAPHSGKVVEAAIGAGMVVKQGEDLLTLEETGAEAITAFVTQEEIVQVMTGTKANVYVPAYDRWVKAEVSDINRTAGFVDEVTEMHRFRAVDARSAKVTLVAMNGDLPPAGTPVTVYFERYRNNVVWRTIDLFLETQ